MAALSLNAHACDGDANAWALEFRALRAVHGHFAGGPWTPDVDAWQGRKHKLMLCLAEHVAKAPTGSAALRELMGPPDETVPCPSAACMKLLPGIQWQGAAPTSSPAGLWIYHWRGRHDRLVFSLATGVVQANGWLHDHE